MIIECDVWVCGEGTVWKNGCGWREEHIERRMIDTDLYEWFGDVGFVRDSLAYPYPGQCTVPHKDRSKRGLCVDRKTLDKIREFLSKGEGGSDMITGYKLERCPFCKAAQACLRLSRNPWQVRCVRCGAEGPEAKSVDEAIDKWNSYTRKEKKDGNGK